MSFVFRAISADPSANLGRLDYSSLSQQTLMEMLIDGITNKEGITKSSSESCDICGWHFVKMDRKKDVKSIYWDSMHLSGSISLEWAPSTLLFIYLQKNSLKGSLDLQRLPASLVCMNISKNLLSGTLFFKDLPSKLQGLHLQHNRFKGSVDFTALPGSLEQLDVSHNHLSGTVILRALPENMRGLWLGSNNFEGETDFTKLGRVDTIDVQNTRLSGKIQRKGHLTVMNKNSNVEEIE